MKRWHQDKKIAKRNQHLCTTSDVGDLGRFRKQDAFDCGKTKCMVCHCEKILNIPTHKELIARERFKQQLADLN